MFSFKLCLLLFFTSLVSALPVRSFYLPPPPKLHLTHLSPQFESSKSTELGGGGTRGQPSPNVGAPWRRDKLSTDTGAPWRRIEDSTDGGAPWKRSDDSANGGAPW